MSTPDARALAAAKVGLTLNGKWHLNHLLDMGGMAAVYAATHRNGRKVAVKMLSPQFATHKEVRERFLREGYAANRVAHPGVVSILDDDTSEDGSVFLVMELLEGESLDSWIQRVGGILSAADVLAVGDQLLDILIVAHRAGIIHRDISPENLMLTHDTSHVKIIDLGVAKSDDPTAKITQAGMFLGKFRYAAPEQLGFLKAGESIDGRADLYALAIVLYEMVSGRPPFEATSPHEYVILHSQEREPRPIDVSNIAGGERLEGVLRRALERDRDKRFAGAAEFAAELENVERSLATAQTVASYPLPTLPSSTAVPATVPATTVPVTQLPVPAPETLPPNATSRAGGQVLILGAIVGLVLLAGAVAWFSRDLEKSASSPPRSPASSASATLTAAKTPVATPADVTATHPPPVTATASSPPAISTQAETNEPERHHRDSSTAARDGEQARKEPSTSLTFMDDGRGHGEENDAAIAHARKSLEGVTRVALRGKASPLLDELKDRIAPFLTVDNDSDVVVRFSGSLERFRFGRKRRSATATVTRGGRVVFRYELPAEIYRVGDDPAEAVARVLRKITGS